MAEQAQDLAPELPDRGGSFLFDPVGARPFVTPERFSDDQRQFFRTGAEFTRSEIVANRERFAGHDSGNLRRLIEMAGDLGLLGVDVPEEFGGLGLDKVTSMLVAESQAVDGSWAVTFGAHTGIGTLPIAFFGTPEQKAKYLPDLASGRKVAAYALSEAGSGSDALGARTQGTLDATLGPRPHITAKLRVPGTFDVDQWLGVSAHPADRATALPAAGAAPLPVRKAGGRTKRVVATKGASKQVPAGAKAQPAKPVAAKAKPVAVKSNAGSKAARATASVRG